LCFNFIKAKKKSNVVALSIFLIILFGLGVKYLIIKLETLKYKKLWEENQKFMNSLNSKCFYVKKAYLERVLHHNGTILYIKLPERYFLPLKNENVIFLDDGVYLKKVVNKVYLSNIELTSYNFLIKNTEICVE